MMRFNVSFTNFNFKLFELMKDLEKATMLMDYTEHKENASEASRTFLRGTHRVSLDG